MLEKNEDLIIGFATDADQSTNEMYIRLVDDRTKDWLVYHASTDKLEAEHFDKYKENRVIVLEYHYKLPYSHITRVLKCTNKWLNTDKQTKDTAFSFIKKMFSKTESKEEPFVCNEYFYEVLTELGKNKFVRHTAYSTLEDIHGVVEKFNEQGVLTYFRKTEGY